jgi:hypothetical protein
MLSEEHQRVRHDPPFSADIRLSSASSFWRLVILSPISRSAVQLLVLGGMSPGKVLATHNQRSF